MTDMLRFITKGVLLMFTLSLVLPAAGRAAENAVDATTAANPVPPKHHHKHKKKVSVSTTSNGTVAPTPDTGSNKKTAASNTDAPGMSDSLGTNNPGSPNMGSPDHTPGTTGTSGQ